MTPQTSDTINQILVVAIPAVLAFFVGHLRLIPGIKQPATPAPLDPAQTPANKYAPIGQGGILQMMNDVLPHPAPGVPLSPIGQGGLLQIVGAALQSIMSQPNATPAQRAAAASKVVEATASLVEGK